MPDALPARVASLTEEVVGLRADTHALREQLGTQRRRLGWVALLAVIGIGLGAAVGITAWRGAQTDHRVDAFCPVLALVVGGADPSSRPAGPARDAYVSGMQVMARTYEDLGCRAIAPLVPPRTTN